MPYRYDPSKYPGHFIPFRPIRWDQARTDSVIDDDVLAPDQLLLLLGIKEAMPEGRSGQHAGRKRDSSYDSVGCAEGTRPDPTTNAAAPPPKRKRTKKQKCPER